MDDYYKNKKLVEQTKRINKERFQQHSHKRLMNNIAKKFDTTIIGALAAFEDIFGYLWGHDKGGPFDEKQEEFHALWQEARSKILNNGNSQSRGAMDEISEYDTTWNKYKLDFIIRKPEDKS